MSVAVIGGAGFIGSHLVDELATQGHEVTVLDNFSEGRIANLERWRSNPRVEVIRGDVRDRHMVKGVCDHRSWVFHLAAMSRIQPSIDDPHLAFEQNVMGTVNILEACRLGGVKRVVYSASSSRYGDRHSELIMNGGHLDEDLPADCGSPYSLSKHMGEELMGLYHRLYGMSTVSLRYFNVFGPRQPEEGAYATVIGVFRKQKRLGQPLTIVGDGEQRRDFTFVGDVVRANMMAAMNQELCGTINIGTGQNVSINELAALVAPGHPTENIPARKGEYKATRADIARARNDLGWSPNVDLQQGLALLDRYEEATRPVYCSFNTESFK